MNPLKNEQDSFNISELGQLLNKSGFVIAKPEQFCLEKFSEYNYQILPIVCSEDIFIEPKNISIKNVVHIIGMGLSLPFLLTTFLVYALIKELRNLHGKSLMCHIASLMMAYISLIIIKFASDEMSKGSCVILGK